MVRTKYRLTRRRGSSPRAGPLRPARPLSSVSSVSPTVPEPSLDLIVPHLSRSLPLVEAAHAQPQRLSHSVSRIQSP
jgi:hypothetical protein